MKLVHHGARAVLGMQPSPDDTDDSPKTEFFGYVVPDFFLFQIFSMACFLLGFAGFTFLDVFLIEQSNECDANNPVLACFTTNASNMTERVNCSTIDSTFNGSVPDLQCYEFVFRVSEALGAAGGILATLGLAFTVVAMFILCISKGKDGWESKSRCFCTICTQAMVFALALVLLFILPFIDIVDDRPGSKQTFIELFMLFIIVCITVAVPWPFFKKVPTAEHPWDVYCGANHSRDTSYNKITSNKWNTKELPVYTEN